jgi:hypothetical protein
MTKEEAIHHLEPFMGEIDLMVELAEGVTCSGGVEMNVESVDYRIAPDGTGRLVFIVR